MPVLTSIKKLTLTDSLSATVFTAKGFATFFCRLFTTVPIRKVIQRIALAYHCQIAEGSSLPAHILL